MRWANLIQVAALFFLQVYAALPVFGHMAAPVHHGAVCRGDHRLCGCPLEKIVNQTCCCFQSADMSIDLINHHEMHSAQMPVVNMNRLLRLACLPCGSDPDFEFASLEKIKFLRFTPVLEGSDSFGTFNFPISGGSLQTRSIEPPDPPPKFIAL